MKFDVFIVDDDPIVVMLQEKMVLTSGFHLNPASFPSGRLALDSILKDSGPDKTYFILLDINMPDMNGWEFLDEIVRLNFECLILVAVVSSSTNESDKRRASKYDAVIEYIEKPMNIDYMQSLKLVPALSRFFTK